MKSSQPQVHSGQLQSLFSQKLDRAVFGTYFLGAVVPTMALGFVVHQFALPSLRADGGGTLGMIGALVGVGVLSLAAFFALRRLVHTAVSRMDADNLRLTTILAASQEFSGAVHTHAVADTAASCALALSDARASYVLLQSAKDKPLLVCESAGEDPAPLYQSNQEQISEVLDAAVQGQSRVVAMGDGAQDAPSAIAVVPLTLPNGLRGAFVLLAVERGATFSSEQLDGVSSLAGFTSMAFQSADLQNSQRNFFAHVTEILVAALDAQLDQGDSRAGHSTRIASLANSLGRELDLSEERLQQLHFASLLHDIGYLKIDRALHFDPVQCRNHPALGHRMLSRIRLWQEVAPIVLYHHEWFDGSGYPESRSGSDIPLESRIVSVADHFDKWTHDDAERAALPVDEAVEKLAETAGTQFDPAVVNALKSIVGRSDLVA